MPLNDLRIDRASPVPLWFQVAQQIEKALQEGDLDVGDRLGNEIALADQLGLSRPTMRTAIGHLVDKGLVVRQRGVGTTVVRRTVERPVQLSSLYDDLALAGQHPTTEVLMLQRVSADERVAERLQLSTGEELVHLVRLRRANGSPLALLENWLPRSVGQPLTEQSLSARGLYAVLRASGVEIRNARQSIGAKAAGGTEARALDLRRGAPLLTMERLSFDATGKPVELGVHVYDAEAYRFTLELPA